MKQIAVVGMSSFGLHLAERLTDLGCEVLAVDRDEALVNEIKSRVASAAVADITDPHVIRDLHLSEMDAVVLSLGSQFETCMLAALRLLEANARQIVVKAIKEEHVKIFEIIGVHRVVFPERDMAWHAAATLLNANVTDYLPLSAEYSIVEIEPAPEMLAKTLKELDFRSRYGCQVIAIKSNQGERKARLAHPESVIHPDDTLVVIGRDKVLGGMKERTPKSS